MFKRPSTNCLFLFLKQKTEYTESRLETKNEIPIDFIKKRSFNKVSRIFTVSLFSNVHRETRNTRPPDSMTASNK